MQMSHELEVASEQLIKLAMNGDSATRILVGNLVNFLAMKGVIDREEYLKYVEETKEFLIKESDSSDTDKTQMIETLFDLHINDFKSPE